MIYRIVIALNIVIFITKNKRCCNEIIILICIFIRIKDYLLQPFKKWIINPEFKE